jgi:predicted Zn-dependent protease
MIRKLALLSAVAALMLSGCASNPATGGHDVVLGTKKGEIETSRRLYEQIIRTYGLYEDQAVQEYVNSVGQKVAKNSDLPDWKFTFTVLDDESVNAFTTGGGYVYVHRGLLAYLTTEAELAAVLGHEIGHVTARHPARQQTRGVLAQVLATGAAIMTGSSAIANMANIGAEAWLQGYGRGAEMEADRLGLMYATKSGYRPEAMGQVFEVFRSQESFELQRAKDEGREPQIYHGVFSSHPSPDERSVQAAKGAAGISEQPEGGWIDNRDAYLKAIDGLPYGSSRAQGIVRDNRFYHADMGITIAFPKGWTIENQHDRIIAYSKTAGRAPQVADQNPLQNKDSIMQITLEQHPEKKGPREFLLENLKGASVSHGEEIEVNGMQGYTLVTRNGSPLDGGEGPIRWTVLYRDKSAFLFGAASRSGTRGLPADDGLFQSTVQTMRSLKPSEYPLAQPYRIKVIPVTESTKLDQYAKNVPVEKYQKEELELLNGIYPKGKLTPGESIKVVE